MSPRDGSRRFRRKGNPRPAASYRGARRNAALRTATGRPRAWEAQLRERWLTDDLAALARDLHCSPRTLRRHAEKLGLGPRDPVQRALAAGADPARVHAASPSLFPAGLAPVRSGDPVAPTPDRRGGAPSASPPS